MIAVPEPRPPLGSVTMARRTHINFSYEPFSYTKDIAWSGDHDYVSLGNGSLVVLRVSCY